MKLYTYDPAPNPRRLELFLTWKGIEIETHQVDLMTAEQLGDEYRAINPDCTVPALVLDDGTVLTEVIGMCTYLEALYPEKPLLGTTPLEKAQVASWDHKIFLGPFMAIASMLRNKSDGFRDRGLPGALNLPQIPELADRGLLQLQDILPKINVHLADNTWVAGDNLSFADIDLLVCVDFLAWVKQSVPEDCTHLKAWYERASAELT
jgi:glutathione S-transferase